jgi:hypothetical protein
MCLEEVIVADSLILVGLHARSLHQRSLSGVQTLQTAPVSFSSTPANCVAIQTGARCIAQLVELSHLQITVQSQVAWSSRHYVSLGEMQVHSCLELRVVALSLHANIRSCCWGIEGAAVNLQASVQRVQACLHLRCSMREPWTAWSVVATC